MRRLGVIMVTAMTLSGLTWSLSGGLQASAQQSPGAAEIHRAHAGSFAPEPGKTIYILILGSDAGAPRYGRGGTAERGRSDAIQLLAINPQRGIASIVGIPRDAYVNIPGSGANKINAAMAFGGPGLAVRTVEGLTGIRFDYYMLTSFQTFIGMAGEYDNGLTIFVPFNMHDPDSNTDFDRGLRHLDAGRLLGMARNRHDAPQGDFDRSRNQGRILAVAHSDARKRIARDPTELLRFLGIFRRFVQMNIPAAEQLKLGLLALRINPANVKQTVCPGTTGTRGGASVVILSCGAVFADFRDNGVLGG